MRWTIPKHWVVCGVLVAVGLAGLAHAQDRPRTEYKVMTFEQLARELDKDRDKGEKGGFEKKDGVKEKYEPRERFDPATLVASLNRLAKEGWEAVAGGERGILFRKAKAGQTWEYRTVKAPNSTLNGKGTDDEILLLVLEGLAAQGWEPWSLGVGDGSAMLFRRQVQLPPLDEKKGEAKKG